MKLPNITKGMVSNIQRFCIHDGPGIRTVVFLKGCPLNCFWCENPELQKKENEIFYSQEKCILCKHCMEVCPTKALTIKDNKVNLNRELCNVCGICTSVCYAGALVKVSEYKSVLETFKEVVKDLGVFRQSEGGLTVSGGEPLYQVEFTLELLKLAKERNVHTTLETSGYALWSSVEKIIPYTDLFLYDLKHLDKKKHFEGTRVTNDIILNNLQKLINKDSKIIIRIPVIPNFNYEKSTLLEMAKYIKKIGITNLDLLSYHQLGRKKYVKLGRNYIGSNLQIDENKLKQWRHEIMKKVDIKVFIDGKD